MPDLVAHLASGYVCAAPFWGRTSVRLLFWTGVLLPDLLTRPFYILFPPAFWPVMPMHTPIGYLCAVGLLVQVFAERHLRKTAFWSLSAGGLLHFALDALQRHIGDGYHWLFPLSWCSYSEGLFWPEDSLQVLPWCVGVIILNELWFRTQRAKTSRPK